MRAIDWKPKAALFDLDGTLVDSEPLFEHSEKALLADWDRALHRGPLQSSLPPGAGSYLLPPRALIKRLFAG